MTIKEEIIRMLDAIEDEIYYISEQDSEYQDDLLEQLNMFYNADNPYDNLDVLVNIIKDINYRKENRKYCHKDNDTSNKKHCKGCCNKNNNNTSKEENKDNTSSNIEEDEYDISLYHLCNLQPNIDKEDEYKVFIKEPSKDHPKDCDKVNLNTKEQSKECNHVNKVNLNTEKTMNKDCGFRFNSNKNRVDLVPTELIEQVGLVMTYGAYKYTPENWKKFDDKQKSDIMGSLLRHIIAHQNGEIYDSETKLPHLAHAACNIGFLLYFMNQDKKLSNSINKDVLDHIIKTYKK